MAGGDTKKAKPAVSSSQSKNAAPTTGVSKEIGSTDATGDVTLGSLDSSNGFDVKLAVNITNHSSKRSDYFVTVVIESADGKTQIDSGDAAVMGLEPGQTAQDDAVFIKVSTVPTGAKAVLKQVQRTAS